MSGLWCKLTLANLNSGARVITLPSNVLAEILKYLLVLANVGEAFPSSSLVSTIRLHLLPHLAAVLTEVFRAPILQVACVKAQHPGAPTPVHDPAYPAPVPSSSAVPLAPQPPSTRAVALAVTRRAQRVA